MNFGVDEIRKLCTEASFERGKRYLDEGRVNILEASPTGVTAEVQGTEKYNVKVDLKNGISAECNCPYDLEGYCKHIVAVLLSMLDNKEEIETMMAKSRQDQEAALALLKEADPVGAEGISAQRDGASPFSKGPFYDLVFPKR